MELFTSRQRWSHVQRIFADVVDLDSADRQARLERLCGEDRALRRAVESLLDRHAQGAAIGEKDFDDDEAWVREILAESAPDPAKPSSGRAENQAENQGGQRVGRYRLLGELGRGAMGVVYRAEDTRLGRPVALKFLSPALSTDQRARARLEREARAASALDHPNICTLYEIGETDEGQLYLALACYDGETLERRIERGPLEVDEAVRIAVAVARGLAAAHRHGIVHRDVKPSNILVTADGAVKLLDFGIARVADSSLTDSGDVLGTVAYMSPEQLRGEVDARADVWALGVVLYEMLTSNRPYGGDYEAAVLYAVLHEDPPPLDRADVPDDLAAIVCRCLEKDQEDRYQTAEDVEVELERLGLGAASAPVRRIPRRTQRLAFGGGALTLLLLMLFITPLGTTISESLGLSSRPDMQHIAVLPLTVSDGEASVGEGLLRELIHGLTQLGARKDPQVTVVARPELGDVATPEEARARFGVEAVISGRLDRGDENDGLVLELVDTRSAKMIESVQVSEPRGRLPILQRRALVAAAAMTGITLTDEEVEALYIGGTSDSDALAYYWGAMGYLERYDILENVDTAIDLFHRAVENDTLYAAAYAGLSSAYRLHYLATRDPQYVHLAEESAQRAVALEDGLASAYAALGNVYALRGRYSDAIRELNVAVELNPLDAAAHVGRAAALRALGRFPGAEESLKRAIDLQPNVWSHHNELGRLYLAAGRYDEATETFNRVVESAPDNAWGYANLSAAHLFQADLEEAQAYAERANRIQPTAFAYSNLGAVAYYSGDIDEEIRMYKQAVALDSTNRALWGNLGGAYMRDGRSELAMVSFKRAAELAQQALIINPMSPELIMDYAGYAVHVDVSEARRSLERAVSLAPNDATILIRAAQILEFSGDRGEALHWVGKALEAGYPLEEIEADPQFDALREEASYADITQPFR